MLGDDETGNSDGEIIAIEVDDEGEEEVSLECKAMDLFGVTSNTSSEIKTVFGG